MVCFFKKSVYIARTKARSMTMHFFPFLCHLCAPPPPPSTLQVWDGSCCADWTANEILSHLHCHFNETFLSPLCLTTQQRNTSNNNNVSKWALPKHSFLLTTAVSNLYISTDQAGENFLWIQPKTLSGQWHSRKWLWIWLPVWELERMWGTLCLCVQSVGPWLSANHYTWLMACGHCNQVLLSYNVKERGEVSLKFEKHKVNLCFSRLWYRFTSDRV